MSRLDLAVDAERPRMRGRVMISGPKGAGKTRTALMWATELAEGGPIVLIDTERQGVDPITGVDVWSSDCYADDFTFRRLGWKPPFDPRELAQVVTEAGTKHNVVVIDSGSHFWQKEGGTLSIADGAYTGWSEARPAQDDLVQAMITAGCHVIFCVRTKMKHEQVQVDGRWTVRKLGLGPVQDAEIEYDMNVSLTIDMGHTLSVAGSRSPALQVGRDFPPGHAQQAAQLYRDWLNRNEAPAPREVVEALKARMEAFPSTHDGQPVRAAVKQAFFASFGQPDQLREAHVAEATKLIDDHAADLADHDGDAASPGEVPTQAEPPTPDEARPASRARKPAGARKAAAARNGAG